MNKLLLFIISSVICIQSFAQEQLLNSSFENWTVNETLSSDDLTDWTGANTYCVYTNESTICNVTALKTTDAYSGTYAAKLVNIDADGKTYVGQLMYAKINGENVEYYDFTSKPKKLTGYYKFNNAGTDKVTITISITGNDGTDVVSYGSLDITNSKTDYTAFSVPVFSYSSNAPKNIIIYIGFNNNPSLSSTFTVDALNLEYSNTTGIFDSKANTGGIRFFPNPATDNLHFEYPVSNISINTSNGAPLLNHTTQTEELNVNSLLPGMYILSYQYNDQLVHTKFIKE